MLLLEPSRKQPRQSGRARTRDVDSTLEELARGTVAAIERTVGADEPTEAARISHSRRVDEGRTCGSKGMLSVAKGEHRIFLNSL